MTMRKSLHCRLERSERGCLFAFGFLRRKFVIVLWPVAFSIEWGY